MSRRHSLDPETAEACYRDYCAWLEALRTLAPKQLRAKYGISQHTLERYAKRDHKTRRVA